MLGTDYSPVYRKTRSDCLLQTWNRICLTSKGAAARPACSPTTSLGRPRLQEGHKKSTSGLLPCSLMLAGLACPCSLPQGRWGSVMMHTARRKIIAENCFLSDLSDHSLHLAGSFLTRQKRVRIQGMWQLPFLCYYIHPVHDRLVMPCTALSGQLLWVCVQEHWAHALLFQVGPHFSPYCCAQGAFASCCLRVSLMGVKVFSLMCNLAELTEGFNAGLASVLVWHGVMEPHLAAMPHPQALWSMFPAVLSVGPTPVSVDVSGEQYR